MGVYQIWVLNLNKWDIWFAGAPYTPNDNSYAKCLKEWAIQEGAELCWNLAFFNMGTTANLKNKCAYRTLEYVKAKDSILGYGGTNARIVLNDKNECSGWKLAIQDGIVKPLDNISRRTRNMNGMTADGRYIHVQTTSKLTEKAVATYVNNYIKKNYNTTVKLLLVQDAGGSTGCYSTVSKILSAGEQEGYNGRAIVTVVCAKRKNTISPISRTLKYCCKGDDVKLLQQVLNGVEIDGVYGLGTKAQVKTAQKNLSLTADGCCGPATQTKMKLR